MSDFEINNPTQERPLLVGLLVDVSGSMTSSISNPGGPSQNRLQAFQEALEQLASNFQESVDNGNSEGLIEVFAYGFGFGNILSAFLGGGGPPVQDLISGMPNSNNPVALDELAQDWESFKSHVEGQATKMFGATPMVEGFNVALKRFQKEGSKKDYSGKLLFVLSDGDPTDGSSSDVLNVVSEFRSQNIGVISCFVTGNNITESRTLYSEPDSTWPEAARLMLSCASTLPDQSQMETYLTEHRWTFQKEPKLFCQINQSDVLSEFIGLILSTTEKKDVARESGEVFISYSHKDRDWLEKIRVYLKPLEREGKLSIWDDSKIGVGQKWHDSIHDVLERSSLVLLVISADFLASDFVVEAELPSILKGYEKRGTKIIPVLVRHSRFEHDPILKEFQSFNSPSKPLSSLPEFEQEQLLVELSVVIEEAIQGH